MKLTWKQRFILTKNRLKHKLANLFGVKLKPRTITVTSNVNVSFNDIDQYEDSATTKMAEQIRKDVDQRILQDIEEQASQPRFGR